MEFFIKKLENLNLFLVNKDGKLILRGRKGKLEEDEITKIKNNKEIIDFINTNKGNLIRYLSEQSLTPLVYKLSPLQEGILFHGLYDEGSKAYIVQLSIDFPEGVRIEALKLSWQYVLSNHSILRSGFLHEELSIPVQQVHKTVDMPFVELDYSMYSGSKLEEQITSFLEADRQLGFSFSEPPLIRVAFIKTGEISYKMIITNHHIISDGWSTPIMMAELIEGYEAFVKGETPPVKKEDLYEDYIKYIARKDVQGEEKFWSDYLKNIETPCLLPFSKAGLSRNKAVGEFKEIVSLLDFNFTENLKKYAQKNRITVNTLIQGVWSLLLSKYTANQDVVLGVTVSGRPEELENSEQRIGLYINTLPLYTRIDEKALITDWLLELQSAHATCREHQYTSLSKIQSLSGVKGDLFDSIIVFENYPVSDAFQEGGTLQAGEITGKEQTNYLLTIEAGQGKEFEIKFCYNRSLLPDATVKMIQGHFNTVLNQIINTTASTVSEIDILTKEEKHQLLFDFNDTAVGYPLDKTVVDIFEEKVKSIPNEIAVVYEEEIVTYIELEERSNQLAHHLRSQGVEEDVLVGICLDRSLDMIIAILGVFKAGGAYVPMKPDYPESRINYILNEIKSTIVITDIKSESVIPLIWERNIFVLDANKDLLSEYPVNPLSIPISPTALSYVIYTSGSTGKPKGAMVEHKGMLNHLYAKIDGLEITSNSVVAFTAPFTFDISVWQIFSSLMMGGRIIVYKEEYVRDPALLLGSIHKEGVNILQIVPSYVSSLLEIDSNNILNQLKYFIVTGEAVSASLLADWFSKYPNIPVANAYGPTEASDDVSTHFMYEAPDVINVSIGKPMSNMQLYVVDKFNNLCPLGVQGELWVSGVGVGRGYLNDQRKTKKSFINNPFVKGEKVYKTGDLACWLPDGSLEYLGRIDDQVKVRGHRIELGEIESVLSKENTIKSCCVLARKDSRGINNLIGYVVPKEDFDKQRIVRYLKSNLPDYMVPVLWVELGDMPLTPNGKINRKVLPEPETSELSLQEYVPARNDIEEKLVDIWKHILSINQIGIFDNFFELGGHSLLATRVVSATRKALDIEIAIKDVFVYPTIAELGEHIQGKSKGKLLPSVTPQERTNRIPLSFSQERLWFVDQLEESIAYHIPVIVGLKGDLDISAVEMSLKTILSRHEVLRTVIKSDEGVAYQEILPPDEWKMDRITISDPSELDKIVIDYTSRPFDLSSDYMLRTCLCELGEGKYVLATIFHHISSDGWSDGIFINEFVELYQSQQEKREPSLINLPIQYVDYALWQRKYIEGQLMDVELSYWENQLTDVSPLVLPTDYSRPQIQSTSGAVLSFELDKELRDVLMNTCKEEGVTLFMLLLTAFKVLLYKYSGQQDICVGTPIANRTQTELENLIGFFVNTLAIRSNLEGNPTFIDLLNVVKSTTLDAYEHQLVPFEKVVDRVVDVRDMSTSPLFQVFFALQNTPEEENSELNGIILSSYTSEHTTSRFDISMTAEDIKSGISLEIEYCTDLFKEETIYRMMVHFEELLKNIVIRPKEHIADITILTEAEKEQLLVNFNATQTDYNSKRTVVQLFLDQVAKTPEHTAIVFKGEEMTYTELDRHSNQLAHYLLSNYTLGKEDLIGIKLDRSEWLIISILAVLKTGCAYVPIDPNYPQERISYIKEDSNSGTIIDQDLLDQYQGDKENYDDTLPDMDIQANHLAYVIYTSGSTGKPKGVMVEHKSLINLCLWHQQTYEVTDQSRGALFSGVGFDASVWEIYPYILGGGSLYPIYEDETRYDISWLTNFIEVNEISHIYIPSQICHNLVEQQVYLDQVKILTGGDTLKLTKPTSLKIYNNYGPTENTVVTTFCEVSENQSNAIPIGKPVSNTSVYILGTSEELLPIGVTGELCISGSGLARGYLNQKELTQDKFVKNPFQEGLMYKTGDLARWLPDGNIEFIGRKDDQVKIRGYRIELGEIENVLEEIPDIIQSVVLTKEDTHSNKRLVGYVVSNDTIDKEELQNLLLSKLPEYMVPRLWVALETIPLTNNGKIDKKALPDPDMSDIVKDYVAPQNEIEESLSVIWQDVLGIKQVGIHDNFFELGGDSIITIQVVSRAKHEGLVMQPRDLFKYQTISELAEAIQQGSSLVVGEQGILTGESDLLPIQQWYFNNSYSELEDANYNQTLLLSIDKSMKISYLEEMVQTLVEHHDALRSTYHKEGEEWKQTYSKNVSTLIVEDLSLIPTGNLTESITTVCKFYQRSLSIERGEVFKIIVFKTPEEESDNRLFIVAHHLLIDGVSWRILINDINLILNSLQRETKVDLGVKSSSYRQWVNSIKEYAVNKAFFSQQEYWSSIINSYKTLTVDYSDKGLKKWETVSECHMILDKELTTSLLQDVNQAYGTEINDILLSCLALTISKWSGFENVVVGLEGHGREDIARDIDTSNTVGWFTSLYPISLSLQSNFSLGDVIKSVKEELRSIPDKGLGYGALKYLHPDTAVRDALSGTHWDITFNYLGQFDNIMKEDSIIGLAGEFSGNDVGDQVAFCNKLEVSGSINDGSLVLTWFYSENEYNQDTIKKLSDEYKSNLTALIHHCVSKEARDFTPSDYGLGEEVNYQELDAFLNEDSDSEELLKI